MMASKNIRQLLPKPFHLRNTHHVHDGRQKGYRCRNFHPKSLDTCLNISSTGCNLSHMQGCAETPVFAIQAVSHSPMDAKSQNRDPHAMRDTPPIREPAENAGCSIEVSSWTM